ncbi:MAG: hypothetical protein R3B84_01410 [Zavarzinella sp.]
MNPDEELHALIAEVKTGSTQAIIQLINNYSPVVRATVRALLTDKEMRRHYDSVDIVQSVMFRFCMKLNIGEIQLNDNSQLVALLKKMAYHRFLNKVEYLHAQERDVRLRVNAPLDQSPTAPGVSTKAAWVEEYQEIIRRMTTLEETIARMWGAKSSFNEIGQSLELSEDQVRYVLTKAWERIAAQLNNLWADEISADYIREVYRWYREQHELAE